MCRSSFALALLLSLALSTPASAGEPTVRPDAIDQLAQDVEFDMRVMKGDEERAAGHLTAAATSYALALRIRRDPLLAGRLGVLLVKIGKLEEAPELLMDALHRAVDASPEERVAFLKAYDKAQAAGGWIEVVISQAGAELTVNGEPRNKDKHSAVFMFLIAGKHELRATLDGYDDAVVLTEVNKSDKSRTVTLTLKKRPDLMGQVDELLRNHPRVPIESAEDPPPDEPEKPGPVYGGVEGAPRPEKGNTRVSVDAGPVVVFGVATWQPAVGAVAGVRIRPKEFLSFGLEGRGAWLTSGIEGLQINAMTAGALASGCLHFRWFFGCAIGHLGVINVSGAATSYKPQSDTFVMPGFGGRLGGSFRLARGFVLGASFDAMGLNRGIRVVARQTELVNHPPVMLGMQIVGGWEF